ncbi:MAG: sensor histidine kinase [Clostridia bacterium]|nr:sensor histidine kinase [Clostridia bacterium]
MKRTYSRLFKVIVYFFACITTAVVILNVALLTYLAYPGEDKDIIFYTANANSIYTNICTNIISNNVVDVLYNARKNGFESQWYKAIEEIGLNCKIERISYIDGEEKTYSKYQSPKYAKNVNTSYLDIGSDYLCKRELDDYWKCITTSGKCYPANSEAKAEYRVYFNIPSSNEVVGTQFEEYYDYAYTTARFIGNFIRYGMVLLIISFIFMVISLVYTFKVAGIRDKENKVYLKFWDKVPTLIAITVFVIGFIAWLTLFKFIANIGLDVFNHIIIFCCLALGLAMCIVVMCDSMAIRIKNNSFFVWTNWFLSSVSLSKKKIVLFVIAIWSLFSLAEFISIFAFDLDKTVCMAVFGIIRLVSVLILIALAGQFNRIKEGTENIVNGNMESVIDTSNMIPYFLVHAQNINSINNVISSAVEDKLKSEKMRTELITNVSHDIKTPLTSVINYTDLISKEINDNPKIADYCAVLSRQSIKLKKLIEDLIEASKASTGNIEMNVTQVDVGVVLSQALGEFNDRLSQSELETVVNNRVEGKIKAFADSRYLWRVFDNLLTNICKYSMKGTRVYIDIYEENNFVRIAFKNISSRKLNMSSDELLERFARGDSSRNTEGSGLGLPIAQSLILLMDGKLILTIDGDLFRAEVSLNKAKDLFVPEEKEIVSVSEENNNSDVNVEKTSQAKEKRKRKSKNHIRKSDSLT